MNLIKITDGCPNMCHYCYEPKVQFKDYGIDFIRAVDIMSCHYLKILDMNFLSNPNAISYLESFAKLPNLEKELVCGFDYRRFNFQIAVMFKAANFVKVRWAWDYGFSQQRIHSKVRRTLVKVGYRPETLSVFMLVNWNVSFHECCMKLDLLKVWNVKVNDCCYDGGYPRDEIDYNNNSRFNDKRYWKYEDIKRFRKMCRKHNQMVMFKIDPEYR